MIAHNPIVVAKQQTTKVVHKLNCESDRGNITHIVTTLSVLEDKSIIMEQQLGQLSPEQRQAVLMQAQQEANQRIMQDMIQRMVKTCFNKCAGSSGDRLDSREQACMASCQDQYLETRTQVQQALEQRQSGMH